MKKPLSPPSLPPLSQLSKEAAIIEEIAQITAQSTTHAEATLGDDAAVLSLPAGKQVLVATDALIEGTHFDFAYFTPEEVGYKTVVVNVSDVLAMNGAPTCLTIGLGLPKETPMKMIRAFFMGVQAACKAYGISLVGGDTVSAQHWMVCGHILGCCPAGRVVHRHTVQEKDVFCVTGNLGGAHLAWQVLDNGASADGINTGKELRDRVPKALLDKLVKPKARGDVIQFLQTQNVVPHAMIDLSDGLSTAIYQLCEASKTGAVIQRTQLPLCAQTKKTATDLSLGDPVLCALHGGEDYELLFSVPAEKCEQIAHHKDIHPIGFATKREKNIILVDAQGGREPLSPLGWCHF